MPINLNQICYIKLNLPKYYESSLVKFAKYFEMDVEEARKLVDEECQNLCGEDI